MKKNYATAIARVPPKMQRALEQELDSHVQTHLQADHLEHIQAANAAAARRERAGTKPKPHRIIALLRIHSSVLAPIARAGLSELQPGGWILLAETVPGLLAKVEVQQRNGEYFIARVSTGAVANDLDLTVRGAQKRAPRQRNWELRFLSIPSMHIMAVWSHFPKAPQRDSFIPISLNFAGLRQRRVYSRAAAEKALRRHAIDLIVHWYERYQREAGQKTT